MLSEAAALQLLLVASCIRLLHASPVPSAENCAKNQFAGHSTAELHRLGIALGEARILHP
jgi:hypothetical protein